MVKQLREMGMRGRFQSTLFSPRSFSLIGGLEVTSILVRACQQAGNAQGLCRIMECRNAGLTGRAISVSALARTESRGSHYRSDFPEEDRDWVKHIHVQMKNGLPNVARIVPIAE